MKAIISGATGLIGRNLASRLLNAGHQVVALSRNISTAQKQLPDGITVRQWKNNSAESWQDEIDSSTAIINMAGENIAGRRWNQSVKNEIIESRLASVDLILEAISRSEQKPEVLIQASATGFYGDTGQNVVDENVPAGKGFLADTCKKWEAASTPVELLGVRRVLLRNGVVLSTDGGAVKRMLLPFKLFAGGPLGSGKQGLPWIHIEDECRAIQFLMENKNLKGVFNLSAPQAVNMAAFCKGMGKSLNRPSWISAPGPVLKLVLGEMADEVLLSGQNVSPAALLKAGFKFNFVDIQTALDDIIKNKK